MGTGEEIWTNEHVTQHGLGCLLCLNSHRLPVFKCFTECQQVLKPVSFLDGLKLGLKKSSSHKTDFKKIFEMTRKVIPHSNTKFINEF